MKRWLLMMLMLFSICYAQHGKHTTNYIIHEMYNNRPGAGSEENMYVALKISDGQQTAESIAEIFFTGIKNVDHALNQNEIIFSSFHIDSNVNAANSTANIAYFYLLNKKLSLKRMNGIFCADSVSLLKDVEAQMAVWEIKNEYRQQIFKSIYDRVNRIGKELFFFIPENIQLSKGVSWQDTVKNIEYSITNINKHTIDLAGNSHDSTLNSNEVIKLDKKTFQVLQFSDKHTANYGIDGILKKGYIEQTIHTQNNPSRSVIDTAYTNMIIGGSFWSNALFTNGIMDSAKLYAYINRYDKRFAQNKDFVSIKLSGFQHINNYKKYDEELRKTPPALIAGTYHVSNKINNDNVSEKDFDELVPMLDNSGLYGWLQDSYAQYFLHDIHEKDLNRLNRLVTGFSDREKVAALPMQLWINALKYKNNNDSLKIISNRFMQLDDRYWNNGNAGRYALLTYKMLDDRQLKNDASIFLQNIVKRLQPLYEDSLNDKRFIQKAHLAYAYYLQYQSFAKVDAAKALPLLERASFYSPKSAKEKVYESWYDRVFLHAKESYTDEYLMALSSDNGTKDLALQEYIKEFTDNQGTSFAGLQKFYTKNYNDKDFGTFFRTEVLTKLDNAPLFELLNLNNEKVSLQDFKGKWTVIDFWGTWCGPCVAELPELNKYYKRLKDNKASKINFISIACRDRKETVEDFLAKNNYGMPVLMSDNKIEQDYKIGGYPTKIIISPEGKMIRTDFGFDWQTLIKSLSEL